MTGERTAELEQYLLLAAAEAGRQCLDVVGDGRRRLVAMAHTQAAADVDMRQIDALGGKAVDQAEQFLQRRNERRDFGKL